MDVKELRQQQMKSAFRVLKTPYSVVSELFEVYNLIWNEFYEGSRFMFFSFT